MSDKKIPKEGLKKTEKILEKVVAVSGALLAVVKAAIKVITK